jgi:hypothetical protein
MTVFTKISKMFLILLLGSAVFLFAVDTGKVYIAEGSNTYISKNSSSYVAKFTVKEEELLNYNLDTLELQAAKNALGEYFDTQYENLGYHKVNTPGSVSDYQFKAVYYPDGYGTDDHMWLGPVFVRAKLYNFPGLPTTSGPKGEIVVNIEQKIPAGMRKLIKSSGGKLDSGEGNSDGTDYEGFWGYYTVESQYSFKVNIVQ